MLRFSLSKHIRCYVSTLTITATSSNAALFCLTVSITIFAASSACKRAKPLNNRMLCMIVLTYCGSFLTNRALSGLRVEGFSFEIEAHPLEVHPQVPKHAVCIRAVRQNGDGMKTSHREKSFPLHRDLKLTKTIIKQHPWNPRMALYGKISVHMRQSSSFGRERKTTTQATSRRLPDRFPPRLILFRSSRPADIKTQTAFEAYISCVSLPPRRPLLSACQPASQPSPNRSIWNESFVCVPACSIMPKCVVLRKAKKHRKYFHCEWAAVGQELESERQRLGRGRRGIKSET